MTLVNFLNFISKHEPCTLDLLRRNGFEASIVPAKYYGYIEETECGFVVTQAGRERYLVWKEGWYIVSGSKHRGPFSSLEACFEQLHREGIKGKQTTKTITWSRLSSSTTNDVYDIVYKEK